MAFDVESGVLAIIRCFCVSGGRTEKKEEARTIRNDQKQRSTKVCNEKKSKGSCRVAFWGAQASEMYPKLIITVNQVYATQYMNFRVCFCRAVKMMRRSSCSSLVKRNKQRHKEIKRTRSLSLQNMRAMTSQRPGAGEDSH